MKLRFNTSPLTLSPMTSYSSNYSCTYQHAHKFQIMLVSCTAQSRLLCLMDCQEIADAFKTFCAATADKRLCVAGFWSELCLCICDSCVQQSRQNGNIVSRFRFICQALALAVLWAEPRDRSEVTYDNQRRQVHCALSGTGIHNSEGT